MKHHSRLGRMVAVTMGAMLLGGVPRLCVGKEPGDSVYSVVWYSPSTDAAGAMPLGNGELGINLWVEANGDLIFYLGRNDSFSEVSQLCKPGRVRVSLAPNPFVTGARFRQELKLRDGVCEITAGEPASETKLQVFVEAGAPVVHVLGQSSQPLTVTARAKSWRVEPQPVSDDSAWTLARGPHKLVQAADVFPKAGPDSISWYHRNEHSFAFEETIRVQSLEPIRNTLKDPLLHRTFGGYLTGAGFRSGTNQTLITTQPVKTFHLRVASPCEQTSSAGDWLKLAEDMASQSADGRAALERTTKSWSEFWDRSWVNCDIGPGLDVPLNHHPVRIGIDSQGGNKFPGMIGACRILGHPSVPVAFTRESNTNAPGKIEPPDFAEGLTLEAWVKPDGTAPGRIIDKITAGGADGFLLDTFPGTSLRMIVGTVTLQAPDGILKPGLWQHVAASYDSKSGAMAIYLDGKPVALNASTLSATGSSRHGLFRGQDQVSPEVAGMTVGKAHTLQRYQQACAGRSIYPIKFNGSIFTVEPTALGIKGNPDWRRWGDCHWWQNVRMPYHAMQASGDFDLMRPLFDTFERIRPFAEARAKLYHNVEGCYFAETMTVWGTYANRDYGWDRTGKQPEDVDCLYWRFAWNQGLEVVGLMLDYYDYTGDRVFLTERLLPMATSVLKYFDTRFRKDAAGRIVLDPTQAVETYWHEVINDTPCVAGLNDVSARLCALPANATNPEQRQFFTHMRATAPVIAIEDAKLDGRAVRRIAVAQKYNPQRSNVENPELFPIWPFRVFGLERPMLDEARNAYLLRSDHNDVGWGYDSNVAALLGMTAEAARITKVKLANSNARYRWPATWGPNFDWLPDQCHGGNLMATINYMLLQHAGDKILLLPAWPKDWDVDFKLHAPMQTTVECVYRHGKVEQLRVTPASRAKDVVNLAP